MSPNETMTDNESVLKEALIAVLAVGYPPDFQDEPPHIRRYCYDIMKAVDKCYIAYGALLIRRWSQE